VPTEFLPPTGVIHLRVQGKGGKLRYVPAHLGTLERIDAYLEAAGHRERPARSHSSTPPIQAALICTPQGHGDLRQAIP